MKRYLSVDAALEQILGICPVLPPVHVPLSEAFGLALAEDIIADCSLPTFANSAMDGFAVRYDDLSGNKTYPVSLQVIGQSLAGMSIIPPVLPHSAVRIMTGAAIPADADVVVCVEDTSMQGTDVVLIEKRPAAKGQNIRFAGEDVAKGERVLAAGHKLRPQDIGLLAALGVARVPVVRRPRVAIIPTGDELLPIDAPLSPGKIRNSNESMLAALVLRYGGIPTSMGVTADTTDDVINKIKQALSQDADLILITAGASVGDYDIVKEVVSNLGTIIFWQVAMKPGKPLICGMIGDVPVLGLPGNPTAVFTTGEVFVRPALLHMRGVTSPQQSDICALLDEPVKGSNRRSYVPARVSLTDGDYHVTTRRERKSGSHALSQLVWANALLCVPEDIAGYQAGDRVAVLLL